MRARQRGLTLVEMLVALGIFALVGTASVAVISLALDGQTQLEAQTDALGEVERLRALLRADLAQSIERSAREGTGETLPAMGGGDALPLDPRADELGDLLLVLTRTGWDNPGALRPRSELQRVEYRLRDDALIRRTRPYLDAAPETPHTEQLLLEGIGAVEIAFWDGQTWRPGFAGDDTAPFPPAVRLAFDHPAYARLTNDFLVGAGP